MASYRGVVKIYATWLSDRGLVQVCTILQDMTMSTSPISTSGDGSGSKSVDPPDESGNQVKPMRTIPPSNTQTHTHAHTIH